MEKNIPKRIAVLGSTGSIGTQTLDVVRQHSDSFTVEVLSAFNNSNLLIEQAIEFNPNVVVIGSSALHDKVASALEPYNIKVYSGEESLLQVIEMETIDMVLVALVGFAGLKPTLKVIESGKPIAIANKETFVVAGELVTRMARERAVNLYPVDSEHSAIFQCLVGEFHNPVEKIYLTASGGPFRGQNNDFLSRVTKEEALKHPNWSMGCKVSIDSATLMNKGLEVIEAKWLFGLKPEQIEVVVHPQSIVHSLVQFEDGSIKAQLGLPDMRLPIQYALSYPNRLKSSMPRFDFLNYPEFTFEKPDRETFRCLDLAYAALGKGGNMPCIINAANEVAVGAFLKDRIRFTAIADVIESCMAKASFVQKPGLEDYINSDLQVREIAGSFIR
ncbi:MAG: 1-deoxy-D-xylulose-5-phosphate reductoisomerase [Bacteroidetes bacterium HGW-Bacteroidetes-11]|jgi:1-deoxy-D-xylulose-5-phosphate reductoisomerase|nr:MAG: 1-deoxy-D-xylulose-5-phosphate reductoisomerase [Bacteroidetes bacterium HGW-Bacteroidetes-11]